MLNDKSIVTQFQTAVGKMLTGEQVDLSVYLHNDVCWHLPASLDRFIQGAKRQGINAVIHLLEHAAFQCYQVDTMQFEFHSMINANHLVHQHFTLQAKTINGKDYKSGYQILFKIENEKIIAVWEYFDSGLLLSLVNT